MMQSSIPEDDLVEQEPRLFAFQGLRSPVQKIDCQQTDLGASCVQRHANADFMGALRYRLGHHPVETIIAMDQGKTGEDTKRVEAGLGHRPREVLVSVLTS